MWPDRVLNPRPLTYESGALPTALRGPSKYLVTVYVCVCVWVGDILLVYNHVISELSSSVIKLLCLKGTSKREIFDKLLDVYGESVFFIYRCYINSNKNPALINTLCLFPENNVTLR